MSATSPTLRIVAAICNERRNSDIRADDRALAARIDVKFAELEETK